MKNLVIVESPAKAKTLKKFLGQNYTIEASVGHIRDLPKSKLGIDIDNNFEPQYITIRGKGDVLAKLKKSAKSADKIYLATDPDREGEAIAWHLKYYLQQKDPKSIYRITFNEITKNAVKKSITEARDINMSLVNAQQARRELDRIVGYKISPLLWKKVKKGLSAGRVQSVTLKLICDREEEINNFIPKEYWSLDLKLKDDNKKSIEVKFLSDENGVKDLDNKEQVDAIIAKIKGKKAKVIDNKRSQRIRKPYAPFSTSTLQQEASKLFGYTPSKTMQMAQQLYEGVNIKGQGTVGLLTYIRTDSFRISDEFYNETVTYLTDKYSENSLPIARNVYKSKDKIQDAHEAIRPTNLSLEPDLIKDNLTKEQYKIYKLVFERYLASQMKEAVYNTLKITFEINKVTFTCTGSVLIDEGWLKVYKKNLDKDLDLIIPDYEVGTQLKIDEIIDKQHFTLPPARYSESSLVKTMEELGIGRPSTYAATITNLTSKRYIIKDAKLFYSTELGQIINDIMEKNFENIVDVSFTANMENNLDKIEEGIEEWKEVVKEFYYPFKETLEKAENNIEFIEIKEEISDEICEHCNVNMVIKYGKFGKFLACPNFPDCRNTKPLLESAGVKCPKCKEGEILIKKSKKGRLYYGCENITDCNYMSWDKPTNQICSTCQEPLYERGTKNKKIICLKCNHINEEVQK